MAAVETAVYAHIRANHEVVTHLMSPEEATAHGALALFGEKYGEQVRVVEMGRADEQAYSVELCGGTHVRRTGDIGVLKVVGESALAAGLVGTIIGLSATPALAAWCVGAIAAELSETGVPGPDLAFNLTWHEWLNLRSLCEVSQVVARAALARENSRGAHFREDFPQAGSLEESFFTVARPRGDAVEVTREPVRFTIVRPGETILPEGEPATLVETAP
jgi:fumarate reductase flavoprotein subunit